MVAATGKAGPRYALLVKDRQPYLDRAREAASLTIPHLMPPQGTTKDSTLYQPYQSIGARGVRNLASKLLLATLPPNASFFKYTIDELLADKMTGQDGMRGEIEKALNARERAVMNEVEKSQFRPTAFEIFRQLIVSGNVLAHVPRKGLTRHFRLDTYVVRRDPSGTVLEIVVEEALSYDSLTQDLRAIVDQARAQETPVPGADGNKSTDRNLNLYTHITRLPDGKYEEYQELVGIEVPNTRATYKAKKNPWLALRFTRMDGEDYGRGYVEEFIGDLTSLEVLSQAVAEGSAAAAKLLIMVSPNGTTDIDTVTKARNLDVIEGNEQDVTMLRVEKNADFAVAAAQIQEISQRLAYAFLMQTAIQRQGERVTAEEIRYMAGELDDALGGVYSLLGTELQLPIVPLFEDRMENVRDMPKLPEGATSPAVVTGIDALGRGQDLRNLDAFVAGLGELFGPEELMKRVNTGEYLKRRAAALSIESDGLVLSDQEIQQQEQMQQLMAMLQQLGPNAITQLGQVIQQGQKGEAAQQLQAQKDQAPTNG